MYRKTLILGSNGFIGNSLLRYLSSLDSYEAGGASLSSDISPSSSHHYYQVDMRRIDRLKEVFNHFKPDVVINCSAYSQVDFCQNNKQEAHLLNVECVRILAELCQTYGARLIQLSTDFVFDGTKSDLYVEDDEPNPINYYGETKWMSEQLLPLTCERWNVARVVVVYGRPLVGQHGNVLTLVEERLLKGISVSIVNDQYRTPTYVSDVVRGIRQLIEYDSNGVYHLCGPSCLAVYDLALLWCKHLGLNAKLLHSISSEELRESTPRAPFSGLSFAKAAKDFAYSPMPLEQSFIEMR